MQTYNDFLTILDGTNKNFNNFDIDEKFQIPFKGRNELFRVLDNNYIFTHGKTIHYIDLISNRPLLGSLSWNSKGRRIDDLKYINSDICMILNDQFQYFPERIKNITLNRMAEFIISKNILETTICSYDIGKVWIPSINEILTYTEKQSNDVKNCNRYSLFENNPASKIFGYKDKPVIWWTRSSKLKNNKNIYCIDETGYPIVQNQNCLAFAPICIRLKIN